VPEDTQWNSSHVMDRKVILKLGWQDSKKIRGH
jgi:hypothetical protein